MLETDGSLHERCSLELRYEHGRALLRAGGEPIRGFWCEQHGQWTYEWPISVEWTWADGTTTKQQLRNKK
jgi:hypothetical protein